MPKTKIVEHLELYYFFYFQCTGTFSEKKDLRAATLVRLNPENPVLDLLAVQHLDNRLFMNGSTNKRTLTIYEYNSL